MCDRIFIEWDEIDTGLRRTQELYSPFTLNTRHPDGKNMFFNENTKNQRIIRNAQIIAQADTADMMCLQLLLAFCVPEFEMTRRGILRFSGR